METGMITCPSCGHEFALSDALTSQIREELKGELQEGVARREAEAKRRLDEIRAKEQDLEKSREALDQQVEDKLRQRLSETKEKAAKEMEDRYAGELTDMKEALRKSREDIKNFREQELELRKKQRELEQAKESAELEVARKLDEGRSKIREEVEQKVAEQRRLKDLEKESVINGLKADLVNMTRKANQGSMEVQGEALEQDFESQLKRIFQHDDIQRVPKGVRGADLIQTVRTSDGATCGVIFWETKNTKVWNDQWVSKLKDDMIEGRASLGIIVSVILPQGVNRFGFFEGLWVSDILSAIPLAVSLRNHLIAVNCERQAGVGKNEKMEMLYRYLAGTEFKQKIEGIVEAFTSMQKQLNRERRAMEKIWKEREKQIERVIRNTVGLYGDMQGIIGGQIPKIEALELECAAMKELPEGADGAESVAA